MTSDDESWQKIKATAYHKNSWFIPEFIELATQNIVAEFLQKEIIEKWIRTAPLSEEIVPKNIGIVMAGNIPLVGFHDFLCTLVSGHKQTIKLSSKDDVLLPHLVQQLSTWDARIPERVMFSETLKGCDAYIATGSNNSARYFEYYFRKYHHIIRRNKTSIAVLNGDETSADLENLADDVYQYFGLGCRNVTKIFVPAEYDFLPLLESFKKYNYLIDHNKYKNNYDYQLAVLIINRQYYMTNGSIILHEGKSNFSPIAQLNYEYYDSQDEVLNRLTPNQEIQCIVGKNHIPFGKAQIPSVTDYADGVDILRFLNSVVINK